MREGAPGYVWLVSTILAIVGVTLLTVGAGDGRDVLGIVFGLLAGASYAFYTVFGVRFARQGEQPTHVLAASFAVSGVILVPVFLLSGIAAFLGVLTSRLARVVDRARNMERELRGALKNQTKEKVIDALLADYKKPEDLIGQNGLLKQLTKALVERALQAELTDHLGHGKNQLVANEAGNTRLVHCVVKRNLTRC